MMLPARRLQGESVVTSMNVVSAKINLTIGFCRWTKVVPPIIKPYSAMAVWVFVSVPPRRLRVSWYRQRRSTQFRNDDLIGYVMEPVVTNVS